MTRERLGTHDRIAGLLSNIEQGSSELADRCRTDPGFHKFVIDSSKALAEFYKGLGGEALHVFESRLRRWITEPTDAYFGFGGELFVADRLRRRGVEHRFVRETRLCKTPDIQLVLGNEVAYFEVKTLKESAFDWFANRVLQGLRQRLPNVGISAEKLRLLEGYGQPLVDIAVRKIVERSLNPYGRIEYEGDEGQFTIISSPGRAVWLWPDTADASRVTKDGTPWPQSKLAGFLEQAAAKSQGYEPTFLVWFIPQDFTLAERASGHVARLIDKNGGKYQRVAGVVVLDQVHGWQLFENHSYKTHEERKRLRDSGLLDSIRALKAE